MRTGFRGTFVISWTQTEVDGLSRAPSGALGIGASWRWSGRAVRIDGPGDLLSLGLAEGETEFRARAARRVRKLVGLAKAGRSAVERVPGDDEPYGDRGFAVTDGFALYSISIIDIGSGMPPLLLFDGELPPVDTDLWVVRAELERMAINRVTDQPTGVICFTPGTRIRTDRGEVPVEEISEGDRVQTKDNGLQEVLWKGEKRITGARLYAMPELRPIRLRAGALGVDRPEDDLVVSPSHRMLVKGAKARALFNADEVLVRASDLVDDRLVLRDLTLPSVTYVHLLLPRHEVVFANGLETESFHPAGEALDSVEANSRARLIGMMPGLDRNPMAYGDYARRALSRAEAAILTSPHL
jgi:hypothetical protein